jgi:hypothetical protein
MKLWQSALFVALAGLTTMSAAQEQVTIGRTVNGELTSSDSTLPSGEYYDRYVIDGREGQLVDVRLNAADHDAYVQINGPDGFTAANDDDPDNGLNSRIVVRLPATGRYTILATSYAPRETGAYTLAISEAAAGTAVTEGSRSRSRRADGPPDPVIQLGSNQGGTLANGDERLGSGEFVDSYRFQGRRGQRVAISVESGAFDTYAILYTPDGAQIDNDDRTPGNTNALIERVLPADGEYRLSVTSYRPGETGAYQLSVTESAGPPRIANVQGGPRVFGVFVGISDYGGTGNNDLAFTDDDATDLAAALRQQGVLNPASVVLTNAEGTVEGIRNAVARVGQQAGPNDLFMFFYSGHGQQEDTAVSATEPDGRNETLAVIDGSITDDQLAEWLRPIRARMTMVILDSCYSGGFGRDIVNRPGVMGIWSSEEDLTSLVAERFRAGGYLAHFLRAAFAGEADLNGDRVIDTGELTTFVRRGMVRSDVGELEAETREGIANYQYITVDRGGVMLDDVVFRLGNGRNVAAAAPRAAPAPERARPRGQQGDYVAAPRPAAPSRVQQAPVTGRTAAPTSRGRDPRDTQAVGSR